MDTKTGGSKEFKILDTAGEEDYQNMLDQWIASADGFLLVFAINDLGTFDSLQSKVRRIQKNEADKKPIVLVGNKCDLQDERKVTTQQAQDFAKTIKAKYIETSALTDFNGNVKLAFEECGNMILGSYNADAENKKICLNCSIF